MAPGPNSLPPRAPRLAQGLIPSPRDKLLSRGDWILVAFALAIAYALRFLVVEPAEFGHACDPAPWVGWCAARTALTMTFRHEEIGWAAAAFGVLTWLWQGASHALRGPGPQPGSAAAAQDADVRVVTMSSPTTFLARVALVLGLLGLVLYSWDPAVVGTVLGFIALVRAAARPQLRA